MALSQAEARSCVEAALKQAGSLAIRVSVAIVDEGGYLIELSRMDGAPALSPQIAEAKAAGAAVMGRPGDVLADNYEKRPGFFAAASSLARRPLVPGLGSVLIMRDGRLMGAIGVSGGRPEQDLEVANAGLAALSQH
ncbi:MAG TPA: heme-binding protein [Candidatus Dormibacteraeota bacterium]